MAATAKSGLPPNQTLYCKNLPDKLQKQDLRRNLYMLFATYGVVLDIIALKTMKMRGQAHIVFRDVESCTRAMRALQGFEFFGKEMQLSYAKGKSDTIAKLDGTFKMPSVQEPEPVDAKMTDLQKSVFSGGPPVSAPKAVQPTEEAGKGVKRDREESEEESDEDEGSAMEESDSE